MEKLTGEQILEVLEKNEISAKQFGYEDYDSIELGLGKVTEVQQEGGEGKGESWNSVQFFEDHGVYLRVDGHYTSYNGTDFYDSTIYEVKPVERMVIFYE